MKTQTHYSLHLFRGRKLLAVGLTILSSLPAQGGIIHVATNAVPQPPYTNWAGAATNLQVALNCAGSNDVIWVARGTYVPGNNRAATFQLKAGLALYGGFSGNEGSLAERDPLRHRTILSGDINGDDQTGGSNAENCYHVLKGAPDARLDGFWVVGGNADGTNYDDQCGGGLYTTSRLTVLNCVFSNNMARTTTLYTGGGGAIYAPTIVNVQNCRFVGNMALGPNWGGGAIFLGQLGWLGTSVVANCQFISNLAEKTGGAIQLQDAQPCIIRGCFFEANSGAAGGAIHSTFSSTEVLTCTFLNNRATNFYAGACYAWYGVITVANSVFIGNDTAGDGGAIGHGRCEASIVGCTLTGNRAAANGGAVFNHFPDTYVALTNTILWQNQAGALADAIYSANSNGTLTLDTCLIDGGLTEVLVTNGATLVTRGILLADNPLFVNLAASNVHLRAASPCIDRGTNLSCFLTMTDMDEQPRVFNGRVDIGADEAAIVAATVSRSPDLATTWDVVVDARCQLKFSTNLLATNWVPLGGVVTAAVPQIVTTDTSTAARTRFYRLFWLQP